jgi:hypothetical protein
MGPFSHVESASKKLIVPDGGIVSESARIV